jgi:hypothetical protein
MLDVGNSAQSCCGRDGNAAGRIVLYLPTNRSAAFSLSRSSLQIWASASNAPEDHSSKSVEPTSRERKSNTETSPRPDGARRRDWMANTLAGEGTVPLSLRGGSDRITQGRRSSSAPATMSAEGQWRSPVYRAFCFLNAALRLPLTAFSQYPCEFSGILVCRL